MPVPPAVAKPTRHSLNVLGICCLGLALLLGSRNAAANPLDVFGMGARGAAMGGAMSASVNDESALYYNVAGLARTPEGTGLGLVFAYDDVHIRLKARPTGYDLPDLGPGGQVIGSKYRLRPRTDTNEIPNTYGLHLGLVSALGTQNFRIGAAAFLPVDHLAAQDVRFPDEREQYFSNRLDFELVGQRTQHIVVMAGVAYQLTDWLALGTALSFLPRSTTQGQVYLPDATKQDQMIMVVHNEQDGHLSQNAGLMLTPPGPFRFGLAWRGENWFDLAIENEIQIKGFQNDAAFPVHQRTDIIANYSPHQVTLGGSWRSGSVLATAEAVRMVWSRFRNGQGSLAGFRDTSSVHAGLAWQASPERTLLAGLRWEPSPVPAQTGRTNYVDNDRVVASIGATHDVRFFDKPVKLGWFAQYHQLLPRDTDKSQLPSHPNCTAGGTQLCDELPDDAKDAYGQPISRAAGLQTGNPGFPGFQSWGHLVAIGVDAHWQF